ncbi:alpha/beta hydrolase [Absiella sp. AM29-15]|uniref:alpha/beta hydrolase n=1 Tax=Absiella sp. AM29-15 TaxID=2292278 RepID=UPI000E41241B|nr:alpha/beta hydrolase [Absiella sp. AM29-15]RGC52853.1 alpha/beta hydrolase [Absiella sp. AM29-15]
MINERIKINDTAYMDTYLLHNSKEYNVGKKRPLVIVCPGGGYAFTSDREAEPIALKFNSIGMHAVVLWYTVYDQVKNVPKNALVEAAACVKYVREHSEEWLVDHDQIIICGFSAGGHLALSLAVKWSQSWLCEALHTTSEQLKVNLCILGYPATMVEKVFNEDDFGFASSLIKEPNTANERFFGVKRPTEKELDEYNLLNFVSEDTPPMFVWHTYEDVLVDVNNSLMLGMKLREHHVPFELHIFEKGEHGLALCDRTTARKASHHNDHVIHWFDLCEEWMRAYIDKDGGWKWM